MLPVVHSLSSLQVTPQQQRQLQLWKQNQQQPTMAASAVRQQHGHARSSSSASVLGSGRMKAMMSSTAMVATMTRTMVQHMMT
jgi:hypothetical protein